MWKQSEGTIKIVAMSRSDMWVGIDLGVATFTAFPDGTLVNAARNILALGQREVKRLCASLEAPGIPVL